MIKFLLMLAVCIISIMIIVVIIIDLFGKKDSSDELMDEDKPGTKGPNYL